MSYDEEDVRREEEYDQLRREFDDELYPEHRDQAIEEFTIERLQSFYEKHPDVIQPAVKMMEEGEKLYDAERFSPSAVFSVSAIELFLKSVIIKPFVFGLVHDEELAEIIMNEASKMTGIERYEDLLERLCSRIASIEIKMVYREGASNPIFSEYKEVQKIRNKVLHQGEQCSKENSKRSKEVAMAIFTKIVVPMLRAINLVIQDDSSVVKL